MELIITIVDENLLKRKGKNPSDYYLYQAQNASCFYCGLYMTPQQHGNTGCTRCGYNKTNVALEFHHRNPAEKDFSMAKFKMYKLIDIVKEELDKCDVLCSNCHKEVHHELRDCGAAASAGDF